jgi:hypothetical protein
LDGVARLAITFAVLVGGVRGFSALSVVVPEILTKPSRPSSEFGIATAIFARKCHILDPKKHAFWAFWGPFLAKMAVAIPKSLLGLEGLVNISRTTTARALNPRTILCTVIFELANVEARASADKHYKSNRQTRNSNQYGPSLKEVRPILSDRK